MADPRDIVLGDGAGSVPGVLAEPAGPHAGGVVVLHEAFGLTSHIRSICGRLAGAGYLAVAPALFHRQGAPVLGYDQFDRARPLLGGLRAGQIASDTDAALALLAARGIAAGRRAAVGFCMGGSIALIMATRAGLGAAVTFYGGGVGQGRFGYPPLADAAASLRVPWLGLFGDLDQSIPVPDVERLAQQAARAPVPTEVVRYPDAGHGFHCDERGSYAPAAAADAWSRTLAWLVTYLTG
ncbi:MAG TPA: dienelactone hydrolase family protein [Streptosporangiaceae bacterium]